MKTWLKGFLSGLGANAIGFGLPILIPTVSPVLAALLVYGGAALMILSSAWKIYDLTHFRLETIIYLVKRWGIPVLYDDFIGITGAKGGPRLFYFQAKFRNNTGQYITNFSAYLRNDITDEKLRGYLVLEGQEMASGNVQIPPKKEFAVRVFFHSEFAATNRTHEVLPLLDDGLAAWPSFSFHCDLDEYTFERHFTQKKILKRVQEIQYANRLERPFDRTIPTRLRTISVTSGDLISPRANHLSAVLSDGNVLVAGGHNENSGLRSLELFDRQRRTFSQLLNLQLDQVSHICLLNDGRIAIAFDRRKPLAFVDMAGSSPSVTFSNVLPIEYHQVQYSLTKLPDGRLLLAGTGQNPGDQVAEVYDPRQDTFTKTPDLLAHRFGLHTATLLRDGRILIAGGQGQGARRAEIYRLDGHPIRVGDLVRPRRGHTATLLPEGSPGKVLLVGGLSNASEGAISNMDRPLPILELYDGSTGYFDLIDARLTFARWMHTATVLPDGSVLIVGGLLRSDRVAITTNTIERYFPRRNEIRVEGQLKEGRAGHTAELLNDGSVLMIGGFHQVEGKRTYLNSTEIIPPLSP